MGIISFFFNLVILPSNILTYLGALSLPRGPAGPGGGYGGPGSGGYGPGPGGGPGGYGPGPGGYGR